MPHIIYTWPDQLRQNFRVNLSCGLETHKERKEKLLMRNVFGVITQGAFQWKKKKLTLSAIRKVLTIQSHEGGDTSRREPELIP